jgi:hypothetical protein
MVWKRRLFKVLLRLKNRKNLLELSPENRVNEPQEIFDIICQVTADEERRVSRRIVLVQLPCLGFP